MLEEIEHIYKRKEHKNMEEPVNTNNIVSKFIPFNDINSNSGTSQNV